ncbi:MULTISPECIES: class A beta-lactamase [Actinoalloteichus]|uniref:Beta-lactamase n=1 Tax=Actinoalloteichus fjordicus TaxID=1612552 RepID=A0AAC9PTH5_9PSEU|nr:MULTISPECIES: class A beta-lactamase [Actinoalloteichus]APU15891.1 beta-lactamase class A [Actinoalloteichus fjordicus]APU21953.1 beta-lactamase class A [Actinoalloteichus sp. GBA129-24]
MVRRSRPLTRRTVLGAAASSLVILGVGACSSAGQQATSSPSSAAPQPSPSPPPTPVVLEPAELADLESRFGVRLGVYAHDTGSGTVVAHRADERFPMCSTFKALLGAAILHESSTVELDRHFTWSEADLLYHSPITEGNVASGMSAEQLCDAAIRYSDNTAANLLLTEIGGPAGFTAFVRTLGDDVTRLDRIEPDLSTGEPGDERDTTTPAAFAGDLRSLVLGDALASERRVMLTDWLVGNTTGEGRIRAGTPEGWRLGNKTGSGGYGTVNDTAVLWPPDREPILLTVYTTMGVRYAEYDEAVIAEASSIALAALTAHA